MTTHRFGAAAVIVASCAALAAAASAPDPWARVPTPPTGCYLNNDDFQARLEAAREENRADLERQSRTNQQLSEMVKSIDPMELASRQQQYMMDHPQEAMTLMQRTMALGQEGSQARLEIEEHRKQLVADLEQIDARYHAALDSQIGPLARKFKDLDARAQKDLVVSGESWVYAPWAVKEYNEITDQENAAYERVCSEWLGAEGLYQGWLNRYKEHLVKEQIPNREESELVGAGFMVIIASTPAVSYQPTATLDAVDEYMDQAAQVFAKRRPGPNPHME